MERTERESSEDLKRLVEDLGDTIQRALAETPQISHCPLVPRHYHSAPGAPALA